MKKIIALILILLWLIHAPADAQGFEGNQRWIAIPALEISQEIVTVQYDGYQWDTSTLKDGIGTLQYLPFVTQSNTVIVGHNPGAFAGLDQLEIGDVIYIYNAADVYVFEVGDIFTVDETALWVYYSTEHIQLTLFTCTEKIDKTGHPVERLVVVAYPSL